MARRKGRKKRSREIRMAWEEVGQTIRYAVGSNDRTARLAILMLIAVISWHYWL